MAIVVTKEYVQEVFDKVIQSLSNGASAKTIVDTIANGDSDINEQARNLATLTIVVSIMKNLSDQHDKDYIEKSKLKASIVDVGIIADLDFYISYRSAQLVGMQIAEGKYLDAYQTSMNYLGAGTNGITALIESKLISLSDGSKFKPFVKNLNQGLKKINKIADTHIIVTTLIAPKISDYLGTEEGQQRLNELTHNLNFGLPFVINPLVIPINALFSHQYYEKYAKIGEIYDQVNEEIEKIKKIPVPDWDNHNALEAFDSIKTWFKETLDPINKRMEESGDATDWDNHNAQEAFNNISTWLDQIIKPINERVNALGDAADWDNFDWTREAFDNISDWFKDQFKNLFPSSNDTNPNNLTPDKTLAEKQTSPIILDLNGDGITTTSLDSNKIYFDLNNNQFAERTAWVNAQDGILVRDLNNNGKIDNGAELFGNHTKLSDGINAEHGFAALAQLDDNQDNKIDANDQAWQTLHIWQDTNQNGITDTGELKTLQELGIQSLSTTYQNSTHIDQAGNAHKQIGSATLANGKEIAMNDIWFNTNLADTRYRGDDIQIDLETALLPNVYAFGNIFHLKRIHA